MILKKKKIPNANSKLNFHSGINIIQSTINIIQKKDLKNKNDTPSLIDQSIELINLLNNQENSLESQYFIIIHLIEFCKKIGNSDIKIVKEFQEKLQKLKNPATSTSEKDTINFEKTSIQDASIFIYQTELFKHYLIGDYIEISNGSPEIFNLTKDLYNRFHLEKLKEKLHNIRNESYKMCSYRTEFSTLINVLKNTNDNILNSQALEPECPTLEDLTAIRNNLIYFDFVQSPQNKHQKIESSIFTF